MRIRITGLVAAAVLLTAFPAMAEEATPKKSHWTEKNQLNFQSENGNFSLRMTLLGQFLYSVQDPDFGDSTNSFRTRRVRPSLRGKLFGSVGYRVQYELAGSPSLLDAYVNWGPSTGKLQIGQFKAPFGRQELTSIAKQQFVNRSIASARFAPSRQQGLAVLGKASNKRLEYGLGVFNGNGRNKSKDDNSEKMVAGRVAFNVLGQYKLDETPLDYPDSPRLSFGIGGMTDTTGNGSDAVDVTRLGAEVAFQHKGLGFVGEFYQESADPTGGGSVDTDGYYAQLGYLFPNKRFEVALRASAISPDTPGPSQDRTESGVAFNFFLHKHAHKLQLDYRQLEFDADPTEDGNEIRAQVTVSF